MKIRLSALIALAVLNGCSLSDRVSPLKRTYLEDVDTSKQLENMPFQHSWVWQAVDRGKYNAIYLPPIRMDKLDTSTWAASGTAVITSEADFIAEANEVARYFYAQLLEDFRGYPKSPFTIVDAPGPGVATLSIALTEIGFAHPAAQAGALLVPVPGTGAALGAATTPFAAFALRLTDSTTNVLIATAGDRKFPPIRIVDLNKLTVTSSVREICSNWAEEIVEAINKGRFGEVESRGTFSILPW